MKRKTMTVRFFIFVSQLDLRDIAARVEKNLEDVYEKYGEPYQREVPGGKINELDDV